jgi:outer membrane lipoprotein-sorting protein
MKKRNLLLILVLVLCLCLSACGEKEPTAEEQIGEAKSAMETLTEQTEDRETQRSKLIEKNKVDLKEEIVFSTEVADVKIKAYSIIPWNSLGEDLEQIYFIYDYTNKGSEDTYCNQQIEIQAYQNGVEMTGATYVNDYAGKSIRPETTIENKEVFVIEDKESDILLKITAYSTSNGLRTAAFEESAEFTVKIK